MTDREHSQQRALVQLRERLGITRSERRDEAAVQARLYCKPRERVDNIVPMRPRDGLNGRRPHRTGTLNVKR